MPRSARIHRTGAALLLASVTLTACSSGRPAADAASDPGGAVDSVAVVEEPSAAESLAAVDWKPAAYEAAGCLSRDAWLADGYASVETWDAMPVETQVHDVTGDGEPDALVLVQCPQPTSVGSAGVVVFDGADADHPALGVVGGELFFQGPELTVAGTTITLSGPTVSGDDAYCCAGHWGVVESRWADGRFVPVSTVEARTTQPISSEGLEDGTHVAAVRAVAPGRVYLDLVEWFEGSAARPACLEDDPSAPAVAGCSDFYIRNVDDLVRVLPIAPGAFLEHVDHYTGDYVAIADVTALAGTSSVSDDARGFPFRLTVVDGQVTRLEEIFTP